MAFFAVSYRKLSDRPGSIEVIDGVIVTPLRQIPDERGKIMHMMRSDDPVFEKFGEIYFSVAYPNVIKGWHIHKEMTLNYAVIAGMIKLVLYDSRNGSATRGEIQEIFMGEDNYVRVTVPPRIYNGYKGIGAKPVVVANCATMPHDPTEIERLDPFTKEIPYDWDLRHG
jgi:dTDP-4-dehydrorhamnose 3,5-epimerase